MLHLSSIFSSGRGLPISPWPGHGGPNDPPDPPASPLVIPIFVGILVVIAIIIFFLPSPQTVSSALSLRRSPWTFSWRFSWRLRKQKIQPPKWSDAVGGKVCVPNRLCNACHDAMQQSRLIFKGFKGVTPTQEDFVHLHSSLGDLRASSMELCHLCSLLWYAIPLERRQSLLDEDQVLEEQIQHLFDNPLDGGHSSLDPPHPRELLRKKMQIRINIFTPSPFSGSRAAPLCIQVYRGKEPISKQLEIQEAKPLKSNQIQFTTTTNTKYHFSVAKKWIKECSSKHERCQLKRESDTPFPTRLVYVGDEGDWNVLRLHRTSPADHKKRYLAFSHCWGLDRILTLKSENISSMLVSIPFLALAQNFRDAIEITRRLGFSFIWIDSLCIIQDSNLDWVRESAIMDSIYSYAFLTIASTGSASSSGGCFHSRNPFSLSPCTISNSMLSNLVVTPNASHSATFDDIDHSPLNQRGWVFQERLLSQRILHFSANLLWECCQLTASELDVVGVKYKYTLDEQTYKERHANRMCVAFGTADENTALLREPRASQQEISWRRPAPRHSYEPRVSWNDVRTGYRGAFETLTIPMPLVVERLTPLSNALGFHIRWFELVRLYTKAHLTKPQDKLVAIAGVARKVQRARELTYLAGVWKEYLSLNLLWHLDIPANARPDVYRAPTWSWAAVDGQITHSLGQIKHGLGHGYEFDAQDNQALIEEAEVTIGGNAATDPANLLDGGFIKVRGALYDVFQVLYSSGGASILDERGNPIARFLPDVVVSEPYPKLYCLKICSFKKKHASTVRQGLVLRVHENQKFKRVGFFSNTDEKGFPFWFDAFEPRQPQSVTII